MRQLIKTTCSASIAALMLNALLITSLLSAQAIRENEAQEEEQFIEVTVTPRALDDDSFAMKLLPEENQLKDGNAAVVLLRVIYEQQHYMNKIVPEFQKWLDAEPDDPEMRESLQFDHFFVQLRRAAYLRDADWNYPIGEEPTVGILIPDVQTGRVFVGRGLPLYIRKAIADDNCHLAHEGIFIGLACSRHYARTPFSVCQIVAASSAMNNLEQADLLIQHPDADNLFWAYQKLPAPLIDIAPSASLESDLTRNSIPGLMRESLPEHEDVAAWNEIGAQIMGLLQNFRDVGPESALESAGMMQKLLTYLNANWAEIGDETRNDVDRMSPEELAVRFYLIKSEHFIERFKAAISLPPPQAIEMFEANRETVARLAEEIGIEKFNKVFADLSNVYAASWRPTRKAVALQTIEAIRHYAATHEGKLPESLEEIDLPMPNDPFTGELPTYKLTDGTASLFIVNPATLARHEHIERIEFNYRIRIAR